MRRMRRVLRHPFTSVSLLLCAAVCVLWVRSYAHADEARHIKGPRITLLRSSCGTLLFSQQRWTWNWNWDEGLGFRLDGKADSNFDWARRFGCTLSDFGVFWVGDNNSRQRYYDDGARESIAVLVVPHWAVAAVTLVLPVGTLVHVMRRRRRASGRLCQRCGYDLRAHSAGDRCPECGTAVTGA
jgi:hypothetical protein